MEKDERSQCNFSSSCYIPCTIKDLEQLIPGSMIMIWPPLPHIHTCSPTKAQPCPPSMTSASLVTSPHSLHTWTQRGSWAGQEVIRDRRPRILWPCLALASKMQEKDETSWKGLSLWMSLLVLSAAYTEFLVLFSPGLQVLPAHQPPSIGEWDPVTSDQWMWQASVPGSNLNWQ